MGIRTDTPSATVHGKTCTKQADWTGQASDRKPFLETVATKGPAIHCFPLHPSTARQRLPATLSAPKQTPNRLHPEQLWADAILDAITDSISVHDTDFRILFQNRSNRMSNGNHVGSTCYESLCNLREPCEECPLQSVLRDGRSHTVSRASSHGCTTRYFEITVSPLRDRRGRIVAGVEVARDVTERRRSEEKLRFTSSHDVMTGLNNRLHFEEEVVRLSEAMQFPLSIIMTDVDDLKGINDSHGHAAGDQLLQQVAAILRNAFRSTDIIARIGGDEFAVILPCTDEGSTAETVDRLRRQTDSGDDDGGKEPRLSIGYGTAHNGEEVAAALLTADHSMYRDKMARTGRAPRQRYHYDTSLQPDENI